MYNKNLLFPIVLIALAAAGCDSEAPEPGVERQIEAAPAAYRDLNENGELDPYEDESLPIDVRVDDLLARMTTDQKVRIVSGVGFDLEGLPAEIDKVPGAAGYTIALKNLGIPSIVLADGPAGLRIAPERNGKEQSFYATAFPVATVVSSSWDVELARSVGQAMGNEVRDYGVDILLAPGMNIHRDPRGGRNFEYYSEDPYLSGHIAAALVDGVQSVGVGATPKHYVANNQETNRYLVDTIASERALREIYLRGFEIVVESANPWAIMSAYNQVNGLPASQHEPLLTTVLRDEWGYEGVVMTDWFAGMDDTIAQLQAGNEMLMPGTEDGTAQIRNALDNGQLEVSVLDRNVTRILTAILKSPSFAGNSYSDQPDLAAHAAIARKVAAEGTVLLKNEDGALPLSPGVKNIAAFGNTSYDFISGGTGSGDVNEAYTVSLVDALEANDFVVDDELEQVYGDYIEEQKSLMPEKEAFWEFQAPPPEMPLDSAIIGEKANSADIALITIGRNSGEFQDRPLDGDFYLTEAETSLIADVSAAFQSQQKKAIVILNIGNVVEMVSWRDFPDAIVVPWQGGQEAGNAVVDVLTGAINPSGKLPTTFPVDYQSTPTSGNFPGVNTSDESQLILGIFEATPSRVEYEEGIYVGYRYYDTFDVEPAYEFGYGLSYTDFEYTDLSLNSGTFDSEIDVTMTLTNVGELAGSEVAQFYVRAPSDSLDKPIRELKGFQKTRMLEPGESEVISIALDADDLASFHDDRSAWIAEAGAYVIEVGASSRDIRDEATFEVESAIITEEVIAELSPKDGIDELIPGRSAAGEPAAESGE